MDSVGHEAGEQQRNHLPVWEGVGDFAKWQQGLILSVFMQH